MLEKTIAEKSVFKGRIFDVVQRKVLLANGLECEREVVLHHGGACVLPIDEQGNCYLVEQFRSAVQKELLEIPAGKLERGEDPLQCASRELEEETGFEAGQITLLGEFNPTPAYDTERIHIYLATELRPGQPRLDDGEFLNVLKMPFKTLYQKVLQAQLEDAKTVIAVLLAAQLKREFL